MEQKYTNHNDHGAPAGYTIYDFLPLIGAAITVLGLTLMAQFLTTWSLPTFMRFFMAFFFLVFGAFKLINLPGFAQAYSTYDIIAARSMAYAYLYPFIEIGLGFSYLLNLAPFFTNMVTFIIMLIGSIGVGIELSKGKQIPCACLGAVFKVPMTWVTLTEDLLMAAMAAFMLLY